MLARQIIPSAHRPKCNARVSMCLQPLVHPEPRRELSCLSFCYNLPLFSVAYSLFCQNTGGGGTSRCGPAPRPSRLRSCTRLVTPFPATHPKKESKTSFLPSVSPFTATHTETHSCKSFRCHTYKKRGVSPVHTRPTKNSKFTALSLGQPSACVSLIIGSSGTGRCQWAGQQECRYYPEGAPAGSTKRWR
jgi:hypothetical protein